MVNNRTDHHFPMGSLQQVSTPFYYYDMDILHATLDAIKRQIEGYPFKVHYAVKANGNPRIINEIAQSGLGADLVSGGEIQAAVKAGFEPQELTYSGVGKTDWEIRLGLDKNIGCFNVESIPELEVINALASEMDTTARVALRVNPDIDAHTHKYITTGTAENKFGITLEELENTVKQAIELPNIELRGLHFHIGSQITSMQPYVMLCETVNKLQDQFEQQGIHFPILNMGGGLGIDYSHPDECLIPDFKQYFDVFKRHLNFKQDQQVHFELGRSIVGQCGSLISRTIYIKENRNKKFVILDAGMNDLIRPALYQAHHAIQNLTSRDTQSEAYDIVGPVCESSDVFARDCQLPVTHRGDLIAIRSAGAYGETMSSTYNMRSLPNSIFSDKI